MFLFDSFFNHQVLFLNCLLIQKKDGSDVPSKSKQRISTGIGLPPPPGGSKIAPPPARTPTTSPAHKSASGQHQPTNPEWGEFASASQQQSAASAPPTTNASWVQF